MTQFYSRTDTVLNGDVYNIPFSYIKKNEISVYINNKIFTDWQFLNDSQIQLLSVPSDIHQDAIVSIRRNTDISQKIVNYTNNTMLVKENLNLSQDQLIDAVQEVYDNNIQFKIDTNEDLTVARQEMEEVIATNKQELLDIQSSFETGVNEKLTSVSEAADKINQLEDAIKTAQDAANNASIKANEAQQILNETTIKFEDTVQQATNAAQSAQNAAETLNTFKEEIETEANTQIENIKQTGFYRRGDKLYYTDDTGAEKAFSAGTGLTIGDIIEKDHVLDFEESKGLALLGTWIYKTGVSGVRYGYPETIEKFMREYGEAVEETVELAGSSITIRRHENRRVFYDVKDKAVIDELFAQRGEAMLFGIDEANERIFLPRRTRKQVAINPSDVNGFVEAGLPNITGHFYGGLAGYTDYGGGAFYKHSSTAPTDNTGNGGIITKNQFGFDASRSNPIYGKSDTVQPSASLVLEYMVVGNTEQKSAVTDVVDITTSENDTIPMFTGMYFDFKPNNVSWLKGGQQVNSGGIYTSAYNELVNVLNGSTKYGNLKVVEQSAMIAGVDYSQYWKVNQDEMYFVTPLSSGNRYLVSKGEENGINYRIYSDGYCEQWGTYSFTGNHGTKYNIKLLKTFENNEYNCTRGGSFASGIASLIGVSVVSKAKDSFDVQYTSQNGAAYEISYEWRACGYLAQNERPSDESTLYFKVANALENLEILNGGAVLEALADKIGRQECKAYVTETYKNGTSWYRVYSDGWCEQGGQASKWEGKVTLLKAYEGTNYTGHSTTKHTAVAGGAEGAPRFSPITGSTCFVSSSNSNLMPFWSACGYLAQGQY